MQKTKLVKQAITGTLTATLILSPIAEPMQNIFFPNISITKAANTDSESTNSDFIIKNGVLVDYTGKEQNVVVPEGVTKIGDYAFSEFYSSAKDEVPSNEKLKSIVLPQSLKSIGSCAFGGCEKLKNIEIPDGVTEIGEGAFSNCINLKTVHLPESLTHIAAYLFANCQDLKTVNMPQNITSIGREAFDNCEYLTSITSLPDSLETIGVKAFFGSGLTEFSISKNTTNIGAQAFHNTIWMEQQKKNNPLVVVNGILLDGSTCTDNLVIPDNVTEIAPMAFADNNAITSVTIPDTVTKVGYKAFFKCTNLKKVHIPNQITRIEKFTFYHCYNLTEINIPEGVTYIGEQAFCVCEKLNTINIPSSVTYLGPYAFYATNWLKNLAQKNLAQKNPMVIVNNILIYSDNIGKVVIPDNVVSIQGGAFSENADITSVTIPNSVTTIGSYAFQDCSDLTSVNIPDSVTSIGDSVFNSCPKLKKITIPKSVTDIGTNIISKYPGVIVYGEKDSAIHDYTKKNNLNFVIAGTNFVMPKTVKITSAKRKSKTSIKISYKKDTNADGYQILISTKKSTTGSGQNKHLIAQTKLFTKSTTKTISKLKKGNTHYVQIRAYKMDSDNKKAYSSWSSIKKIK